MLETACSMRELEVQCASVQSFVIVLAYRWYRCPSKIALPPHVPVRFGAMP